MQPCTPEDWESNTIEFLTTEWSYRIIRLHCTCPSSPLLRYSRKSLYNCGHPMKIRVMSGLPNFPVSLCIGPIWLKHNQFILANSTWSSLWHLLFSYLLTISIASQRGSLSHLLPPVPKEEAQHKARCHVSASHSTPAMLLVIDLRLQQSQDPSPTHRHPGGIRTS